MIDLKKLETMLERGFRVKEMARKLCSSPSTIYHSLKTIYAQKNKKKIRDSLISSHELDLIDLLKKLSYMDLRIHKKILIAILVEKKKIKEWRANAILKDLYSQKRLPCIKKEIRETITHSSMELYLKTLHYTDLCLIKREFKLNGANRKEKEQAIIHYFKKFSVIGLYSESIPKNEMVSVLNMAKHRESIPSQEEANANVADPWCKSEEINAIDLIEFNPRRARRWNKNKDKILHAPEIEAK